MKTDKHVSDDDDVVVVDLREMNSTNTNSHRVKNKN